MATSNKLDCIIYVEPEISIGELAQFVTDRLGGSLSGPPFGMTITTPGCEIEVRRNPDYQDDSQKGEDGFLHFRNLLEIYPDVSCQRSGMIDLAGKILTSLWSRSWAAVAACDYEASLPFCGGYGKGSSPWSNIQVDFGKSSSAPRATGTDG